MTAEELRAIYDQKVKKGPVWRVCPKGHPCTILVYSFEESVGGQGPLASPYTIRCDECQKYWCGDCGMELNTS